MGKEHGLIQRVIPVLVNLLGFLIFNFYFPFLHFAPGTYTSCHNSYRVGYFVPFSAVSKEPVKSVARTAMGLDVI